MVKQLRIYYLNEIKDVMFFNLEESNEESNIFYQSRGMNGSPIMKEPDDFSVGEEIQLYKPSRKISPEVAEVYTMKKLKIEDISVNYDDFFEKEYLELRCKKL